LKTHSGQYEKARRVLPGGVNSSVRMNRAIGTPFYVSRAAGSRITDLEDRSFIDMCCAHGAGLLGHAHPGVEAAVRKACELGIASSFETEDHPRRGALPRLP